MIFLPFDLNAQEKMIRISKKILKDLFFHGIYTTDI